jgi:hypothetical protein
VVRCLLITQRTPVLEREPRFVPQVHPCGRTVLKSRLKWSTAWWRGPGFYHRISVDRWILAGGIDRFSIAYSSGFIVQISVRANPDDWVVIDEVPIGGRVGLSIRFFVANFSDGRLKRGRWVLESGAQDRRRAPLFLLLSWVLKIVIVLCCSYSDHRRVHCEWWRSEQKLHARREHLVVDPRCHEFTRMNLSASPLPGAPLSTSGRQIFRVGSEKTQVSEINLMWTQGTRF